MLVLTLMSKPFSGQRTEGQPMAESNGSLLTDLMQTGNMMLIVIHVQEGKCHI